MHIRQRQHHQPTQYQCAHHPFLARPQRPPRGPYKFRTMRYNKHSAHKYDCRHHKWQHGRTVTQNAIISTKQHNPYQRHRNNSNTCANRGILFRPSNPRQKIISIKIHQRKQWRTQHRPPQERRCHQRRIIKRT